jgi:hypothetical protein
LSALLELSQTGQTRAHSPVAIARSAAVRTSTVLERTITGQVTRIEAKQADLPVADLALPKRLVNQKASSIQVASAVELMLQKDPSWQLLQTSRIARHRVELAARKCHRISHHQVQLVSGQIYCLLPASPALWSGHRTSLLLVLTEH